MGQLTIVFSTPRAVAGLAPLAGLSVMRRNSTCYALFHTAPQVRIGMGLKIRAMLAGCLWQCPPPKLLLSPFRFAVSTLGYTHRVRFRDNPECDRASHSSHLLFARLLNLNLLSHLLSLPPCFSVAVFKKVRLLLDFRVVKRLIARRNTEKHDSLNKCTLIAWAFRCSLPV
jgi:hypothetical protein